MAERRGTIVHFWRGARREDRRWWGSLADPPHRRRTAPSLVLIAVFFAIGVALGLAFWLEWIPLPVR